MKALTLLVLLILTASARAQESLWIEAEHLDGIQGYCWPMGKPEMKVTKGDARRFLVARQLLAPARSLVGGPDAVLEVLRRLGSIQLDQVEVAGRSHDLVLHARVADYDRRYRPSPPQVRALLRSVRGRRALSDDLAEALLISS